MPVKERKAREFQRRGQEILKAAVELFSTINWETVTISQIAEKAEVGKGTVYKHFASKDQLIGRMVIKDRREFFERLQSAMETGLDSVEEAALRVVRACWERYMQNPGFIQRLDQFAERDDFNRRIGKTLAAELEEINAGMQSLFFEGLGSGMQEGVFQNGNLPLRIATAWATVDGALRLAARAAAVPLIAGKEEDFQKEVALFILRGLGWSKEGP